MYLFRICAEVTGSKDGENRELFLMNCSIA